jgi:hypothetical protein
MDTLQEQQTESVNESSGNSQTREVFSSVSLAGLKGDELRQMMRVNCFGSLYYFTHVALKRRRLTEGLHKPICTSLERDNIKDVYEMPRDHFKSTICSESLPIWRVLPFGDSDRNNFLKLGYSDVFIDWLSRAHRSDARNLLVSENITNSAKLGKRISFHYESNSVFRYLFPEVIPTTKETWSNFSLHQRVPVSAGSTGGHGEGTFDFLGVGGALQSRHYNGIIIEDDLVGRKAIESVSIMEKTREYHQLVAGAFENEFSNIEESDELVVGNRWDYSDLNSWIQENEPWFKFTNHSALGGCCVLHPEGRPIFPEEFSVEKLDKLKRRLGSYLFSCQYLNNPCAPENADFDPADLMYYSLFKDKDDRWIIHHEVVDGVVRKDIPVSHLNLCLVTDPNHSGNSGDGRCRHAICVVGMNSDGNFYLIDCWARGCNYDTYYGEIYKHADKWGIRKIGVESVAAQKYIIHHIEYVNRLEGRTLKIVPLNGEVDGPDGEITRKKEWRIRNTLSPIFESRRFFVQRSQNEFYSEYTTFPKGRYKDIIDALAYAPQMLKMPSSWMEQQKWKAFNASQARKINQPYSVGVN